MDSKVRSLTDYRFNVTGRNEPSAVGISPPPGAPKPRLLEQFRSCWGTGM